ncbi:uncharacterized protein Z518_05444 [Rhinocladiella mackenziei CBS 650.93]|uniref:DUF7918 domain-containing protein n=1 Tax=Rhinocladiella mackenziei CBS 650.93 TaxID=1442369 RepID=A0A0D2IFI3_9EURO|nr:uncharacterized protein Z518_05444 [Rhinocladiella mackenziei CBS 650.93]KIX04574.1 hypothetical protein Z518_05444 [Rhinocladiella mackenziei CBS 650.93]
MACHQESVKDTISSGGRVLEEYLPIPGKDNPNWSPNSLDTSDTAVKYIETVSNANFHNNLAIRPGHCLNKVNTISFTMYVDGHRMGGRVYNEADYKGEKGNF